MSVVVVVFIYVRIGQAEAMMECVSNRHSSASVGHHFRGKETNRSEHSAMENSKSMTAVRNFSGTGPLQAGKLMQLFTVPA